MTAPADPRELGAPGKLLGLAGARVVAQVLGLGWFLLAARALDAEDFGLLSIGLVLVVVIGGLSDLGTTRTVVRHVAADPGSLRANYGRAVLQRAGAGVVATLLAASAALVLQDELPVAVLVLAALIALTSGATEVGFAALRSVGSVGAEMRLLVGERLLFVVAGSIVLSLGGGPVAVLAVYAATNLVSAAVVGVAALTWPGGGVAGSQPILDAEGRRTALSSTLMIVGPRISALLLVLLVSPTVVGTFSIAQKVPEALGILGAAVLLPVLPLLRATFVAGDGPRAIRHAAHVTATVVAATLPLVLWLCLDGERLLDVLFDAGGRRHGAITLGVLSIVALLWVVRTFGELVLLAEERARSYLVVVAIGVGLNVVLGIAVIPAWGAAGAALAACAAEVVVVALVLTALRQRVGPALARHALPVLGVGVGAGLTLAVAVQLPFAVGVAVTGMWCLVGLTTSGRGLRTGSGASGDHADVGQEVGGDVIGDGVEAVEHLAAPAEHL